jgi:uncharacterized 2Fe-2S/4Fe-4S cluster protein (DUF4445 family)
VAEHTVTFETHAVTVKVPTGTLLVDAARQAGIALTQPCGGQGRCGRCAVQITAGAVRSRSSLRLSSEDVARCFTLACQAVIEGSISVAVPPQDKLERRLTTDRTVAEVTVPAGYAPERSQTIRRVLLNLAPPSLDDQTDDWSRLQTALRNQAGIASVKVSLRTLQQMGAVLREGDWQVTAVLDVPGEALPAGDEQPGSPLEGRLVALYPGRHIAEPLWGAAVDIGTTTVTAWLVDLVSGTVRAQASEYNQQISRGEDVVSRIIYSSKNGGAAEMRSLVLGTINDLLETVCKRVKASPVEVVKTTISGNSTMIHLLLGIPAQSIRLAPYITNVNHLPLLTAAEVGLEICPEAVVDCLPGIASYVGSDITAGVLSSGMDDTEKLTLFMDVGTNGEIVLGSHEWLISCACSAGPAFEGAGVRDGMRATQGAIEEIWIAGRAAPVPYEPNFRVIGNVPPAGLCGSGLLALVAELFLTGVIDKGGNFNTTLPTPRVRQGEHGWEYVVAWAHETSHGRDVVFTRTDIDNLLRAKAAIYAGFSVLATSVGLSLDMVEQVLIGGSFGKYINVEKAVQIGLLPDMPWDRYQFLGNTSVKGAYYALLDREARKKITDIASRMTYLELSADNSFYESFMSALFLPHTDLFRFPSVALAIENER